MKPKTITIIGLGLMGGSLAAACRKAFPAARIVGVTRNAKVLKAACSKGWIHEGFQDIAGGVSEADLIVICTPVDTLPKMLAQIDAAAKPGTVVTDAGSVKGQIADWVAKKKLRNIEFVGAHPMVGSHERGLEAARPDLYSRGFVFVVNPGKKSKAYKSVKNFWQAISSRVIEISASAHDRITSEVSHVPHLIAACLVASASPESLKYAGSGFLDATRIAQGHPSIWVPIFSANRKAVLNSLKKFEKEYVRFKKALAPGHEKELEKILTQAARRRGEISL